VETGASDFIQQWARIVPFGRAGILGAKQVAEAFTERPVATTSKALAAIVAPNLLLYAMNYWQDEYGDLPESRKYRNLSRWTKDTMFILPEVGGVRMRIPNPFGIGILFGGFPVRFLDWWLQNDKHAFDDWASALLTSFAPPMWPTIATPFIEAFADRDLWTGAKLTPAAIERGSDYMQYTENTTEPAKALARVLGDAGMGVADVSPIMIDKWVRDWTGTMGALALRAVGAPFSSSGRPFEVTDIPFVQSFFVRNPRMGAQPIRDFFKDKQKLDEMLIDRRTVQERMARGYQNDPEFMFAMTRATVDLKEFSQSIHRIHNTLLAVANHSNMEAAEKQKWIDTLYSQMIVVARRGSQVAQTYLDANKRPRPDPLLAIGAP
jgi:hypothetical protein